MAALVPVYGGNVGGPHAFTRNHGTPTDFSVPDSQLDVCESLNCNGLRMNYPYGPLYYSEADRDLFISQDDTGGRKHFARDIAERWLNRGNHLMISLLEQPIGRQQNVLFRSQFTATEWTNAQFYNSDPATEPPDDSEAYVVLTMAAIFAAPSNTAGTHSAQKARLCLLNNIIGQDLRNAYPTGTIGQIFNGPEQWEDFNWSPRHAKLRKFITDPSDGVWPNRGLGPPSGGGYGWQLTSASDMPDSVLRTFLDEAATKWGANEPFIGNSLHSYVHKASLSSQILRGWRDSPCVTECGVHRGYPSTGDANEESEFSTDYSQRAPVFEQFMKHLIDAGTAPSWAASRSVEALQLYFFSIIHPGHAGQQWRTPFATNQLYKLWDPVLYRAYVGEPDWVKALFHTYNALPMFPDEPALRDAVINVGQYFKLKHIQGQTESDAMANAYLDHVFGRTPLSQGNCSGCTPAGYIPPGTWHLGLFTKAPTNTDAGVEVTGGGYSRAIIMNNSGNWNAAAAREKTNKLRISFGTVTIDWGRIKGWALFTGPTGGTRQFYGLTNTCPNLTAGIMPSIPAGALKIRRK